MGYAVLINLGAVWGKAVAHSIAIVSFRSGLGLHVQPGWHEQRYRVNRSVKVLMRTDVKVGRETAYGLQVE